MIEEPLVSIVIPTRNRPSLVVRAVLSVVNQTHRNVEIIVVVDGPDGATIAALQALRESRLRIIALPENVGGSEARNLGARHATGEWIALLDDDDEWFPQKLATQMACLPAKQKQNVILSSRYIERSISTSRVYPSRLPDHNERIDDYLCCPRGMSTGGEILQTSTLVVPKSLMERSPFVVGLKRGQDFMWLIRAGHVGQARFHVVPEVLSIFNAEGFTDGSRVSTKPNWRSFYACAKENRDAFTRKAYACCIATRILTDVTKIGEPLSVKLKLLVDCLCSGGVNPRPFLTFIYICLVPQETRKRLGKLVRSLRKHAPDTAQVGAA